MTPTSRLLALGAFALATCAGSRVPSTPAGAPLPDAENPPSRVDPLTPRAFPAARFARAASSSVALARFDWPAGSAFEERWREAEIGTARAWVFLEGRIGDEWLVLVPLRTGDGLLVNQGSWSMQERLAGATLELEDPADAEPGDELRLVTSDGESLLFAVEHVTKDASPGGPAWDDWTYATELLRSSEPIYQLEGGGSRPAGDLPRRFRSAKGLPAEQLRLARKLLESDLPASDWTWDQAATLAKEQGELELAIELRRRYWPRARCSMDSAPQRAGMDFADLCWEAGDRACFLQLQVGVMGDSIGSWMVKSSYGERAHPTYVPRLEEIGIDVEQFLMGLLFSYDVVEPRAVSIGTFRLVRAMVESGDPDRYEALLRAHAEDDGLDEVNRHRAATALAWLRLRRQELSGEEVEPEVLLRDLQTLRLPPMTKRWIDQQL